VIIGAFVYTCSYVVYCCRVELYFVYDELEIVEGKDGSLFPALSQE
jgi:hypothetical protein